ncbi:MAG: NrdJb [Oceanospirillaceae bacterium]
MNTDIKEHKKLNIAHIDRKIINFEIVTHSDDSESLPQNPASNESPDIEIEAVHEHLDRPEMLMGSTYKIKTPMSAHALYITINDVLLNHGTPHEQRHPYEIFINSKNMDHFMWVVALTRVISAVFRKGGDVIFMVEELKAVFDPKGGYFKKGGKYMPSLVAEIGEAIESHLTNIGLLKPSKLDEHQQCLVDKKRAEFKERNQKDIEQTVSETGFPHASQLCNQCLVKAVILMDNCYTCLNCADSKCG